MPSDRYSLAIETSSRRGSVALGRGDEMIETADLGEQRRHAVELLPAVDAMCRRNSVRPADLGEVYVSVGPGSFTGLRIGVTTAKTLGLALGCHLVAVPTLDAVVLNAPPEHALVAVMLNAKAGRCYTGLYERRGDGWAALIEPTLLSPAELCERRMQLFDASPPPFPPPGPTPAERHGQAPRTPLAHATPPPSPPSPPHMAVIADKLPDFDWPADVQCLDPALATPRGEAVWRLGRAAAKDGRFVDPLELTPLYVRLPEPEERWRARQKM